VRGATGDEEPAQKWADVTGRLPDGSVGGLAVLNDAKYGYDICGGEIRLSVLRTPIYCFHEPAKRDERRRYEFVDQGRQVFTYALLAHGGDWREGDVVRQAQQLNHECIVREEPAHEGKLPPVYSFAEIDAPNVIVEAIKLEERGGGVILRAYETHGVETEAELKVEVASEKAARLRFRPCEIKTLRCWENTVTETDMLEGLAWEAGA
jgi:alpha-mannosidase